MQAGNLPGGAISGRWAAGPGTAPARAGRWQAWRARFGLAEVCGTIAAVSGFTAGYLTTGSLLAAALIYALGEASGEFEKSRDDRVVLIGIAGIGGRHRARRDPDRFGPHAIQKRIDLRGELRGRFKIVL